MTLGMIVVCCSIYMFQLLFQNLNMSHYTLCPRLVLYLHEYYRCITSTVFHANLMHLGMNMLSTSAISAPLERQVGTLRHAFSILWAMLLTSGVYLLMAFLVYTVLGNEALMYQHAVGFSGILFHLSVLESNNMSRGSNRSVFGIVSVPSAVYPWVLLLVLQVIMPNISFTGHLAGIVTGTCERYGGGVFWKMWLIPSEAYLMEMEQWRMLQPLVRYPSFCPTPIITTTTTSTNNRDLTSALCCQALRKGIWFLWKWIKDLLECLQYCILGNRGREANSNLHLPRTNHNAMVGSNRTTMPATTTTTRAPTSTSSSSWSLDTDYLDDDDADEEENHNEQRSLLQQQPQRQSPKSSSSPSSSSSLARPTIAKLV